MYFGKQVRRYCPYWCMGELMSREASAGLTPVGSVKGGVEGSAAGSQWDRCGGSKERSEPNNVGADRNDRAEIRVAETAGRPALVAALTAWRHERDAMTRRGVMRWVGYEVVLTRARLDGAEIEVDVRCHTRELDVECVAE